MLHLTKKIGTLLCTFALILGIASFAYAEGEKPNLNLVNVDVISKVEGLNPELAKAIVTYRQDVGDFLNFEEVLQVPGMTKELLPIIQTNFSIEGIADIDCGC